MKPIGYWVKELDRRLEERFEQELGDVSRREWQVLNALPDDPVDLLAPFSGTPEAVERLRARGWVSGRELTEDGATAKAEIAAKVTRLRASVTTGIGDDEYLATVRVLERMVHNLGG
ncbi:helix-turn-helix domain-containing protein [Actinokineospora inagensis]|uniref:helix-turn-helix domain-containing protein n=1 Tax=Actinokineospora inagensis TaxID=103730 RepID=UPI00040820C6|nr:hypothetical protein [Actinokineospora inagensis]